MSVKTDRDFMHAAYIKTPPPPPIRRPNFFDGVGYPPGAGKKCCKPAGIRRVGSTAGLGQKRWE